MQWKTCLGTFDCTFGDTIQVDIAKQAIELWDEEQVWQRQMSSSFCWSFSQNLLKDWLPPANSSGDAFTAVAMFTMEVNSWAYVEDQSLQG